MAYQHLLLDRKDQIATITLNRPDAYNALNRGLGRDLFHAVLEVDDDPDVRCVVITGAGKAFCARAAVNDLARELAHGPTKAFGGAKRLLRQSTWESLETQMELEAQAIATSGRTDDFRDGVTAFANKKTPTFRGR